jgi:hypothetical protein
MSYPSLAHGRPSTVFMDAGATAPANLARLNAIRRP